MNSSVSSQAVATMPMPGGRQIPVNGNLLQKVLANNGRCKIDPVETHKLKEAQITPIRISHLLKASHKKILAQSTTKEAGQTKRKPGERVASELKASASGAGSDPDMREPGRQAPGSTQSFRLFC